MTASPRWPILVATIALTMGCGMGQTPKKAEQPPVSRAVAALEAALDKTVEVAADGNKPYNQLRASWPCPDESVHGVTKGDDVKAGAPRWRTGRPMGCV